jgi:hypothetical protein
MVRYQLNKPFYSLATIQELAEEGKFQFGNRTASRDAKTLDLNMQAVRRFILCLRPPHFYKRYPRLICFDGRAQLDCDAYKMTFDGKALCENASEGDRIFAKLGIYHRGIDDIVAVVSFHLDR